MHIYIYIYTYTHININKYKYIYIYICIHRPPAPAGRLGRAPAPARSHARAAWAAGIQQGGRGERALRSAPFGRVSGWQALLSRERSEVFSTESEVFSTESSIFWMHPRYAESFASEEPGPGWHSCRLSVSASRPNEDSGPCG